MIYVVLIIAVLCVSALVVRYVRSRSGAVVAVEEHEEVPVDELAAIESLDDTECCGQHEVCEKKSILEALRRQIEYYEDEELDRFRGRESDGYSADEIEEFREILYTMREDEVSGWVRSLQLRNVNLPDEMRDEVIMLIRED